MTAIAALVFVCVPDFVGGNISQLLHGRGQHNSASCLAKRFGGRYRWWSLRAFPQSDGGNGWRCGGK